MISDPERCRATAARYGRLGNLTDNALIQQSYRNLQRLWLEMASAIEDTHADAGGSVQKRLNVLISNIDSQRRLTMH